MDDLLADFLTETAEGIAAADSALVWLEQHPDDSKALAEVFRLVHTVKGTCGFLGLVRLERVAHAAEDLLGRYRDGSLAVTSAGISRLLAAIDAIKGIVAGLAATGAEPPGDDGTAIADLAAAVAHPAALAPLGPELPPAAADAVARAAAPPAAALATALAAPQTIRVSVEVLDNLMTLVSELVLTRNQLLQRARGRADDQLALPLQRLSQLTSDLQAGVMKTRMQPIGTAWAKLPRLVRDLSVELGKRIELELRGAETELDRQVLDLIQDPLIHMIRNAADHGLEGPEERRAAGKPEAGRIGLRAWHEGGFIIVALADDGRGLPLGRIRAKALAQGLATEAQLAAMTDRDLQRFIFHPGLSTAAAVSAVSGRGVGMDVVKTNIERIGGTIEVTSRAGLGTTFSIRIPLTLAIVAALIVEAGGERFALPQLGVQELVRISPPGAGGHQLETIRDATVLRLRDRLLPIVPLAALLQLEAEASAPTTPPAFVVVTKAGAELFGVLVDRVFDTEEIVVKPVAPILRHVTIFSGNTILGDGGVIMILDPDRMARAAGIGLDGGETTAPPAVPAPDALATRTALLLFRAGDATPKAVPLGLVARLENVAADRIETTGGRPVIQYRGRLMPLVLMNSAYVQPLPPAGQGRGGSAQRPDPSAGALPPPPCGSDRPVLVFSDGDRSLGLLVDAILDVVELPLAIEPAGARPGILGSLVIDGRLTELIDCAWWLAEGSDEAWFGPAPAASAGPAGAGGPRLLLVEDSAFFRNLAAPVLTAAGYRVATVADAEQALRLRDAGVAFDAILTDIALPGRDGFELAAALRAAGPWRDLPLIALSARHQPTDLARGRAAGFTDYIAKFDRAALLASLRQCLASTAA